MTFMRLKDLAEMSLLQSGTQYDLKIKVNITSVYDGNDGYTKASFSHISDRIQKQWIKGEFQKLKSIIPRKVKCITKLATSKSNPNSSFSVSGPMNVPVAEFNFEATIPYFKIEVSQEIIDSVNKYYKSTSYRGVFVISVELQPLLRS